MRVLYRVHEHDAALRRRLDAVLHTVLDDSLEPALARAGVRVAEEICIRTVRAPVRLSLDGGDAAAAAAWSVAIAEQIAAALGEPGADVVRYRSRRDALVDLALSVAENRFERSWAWRRLGLWRGTAAPGARAAADELVGALAREPASIAAVLAATARAGALGRLVPRFADSTWVTLARLALVEAEAVASLVDDAVDSRPDARARAGDSRSILATSRRAGRVLTSSALARAVTSLSPPPSPNALAALAALAWLEAEPGEAAALPVAAGTQVLTALAGELARAAETTTTEAEQQSGEVRGGHEERDAPRETSPPPRHTTRFAGILFLLSALDELGFPGEVVTTGPLAGRGVRWTLHRLALTLVPADRDDPAALAFAGLEPTAEPPSDGERRPEPVELEALAALAGRIVEVLRARLLTPDAPAQELVDFVCRRRGEIESDPGWLELRLPLDELSVELRKAGLDLDPGWVPWLGCVVRFVYV
jgi:hypothetical protein